MTAMLKLSGRIDAFLTFIGTIGAWCCLLLIFLVCFDVVTRYLGVPKPFGINSTQIQEAEYWLHAYLFALMIGFAYLRQAHVRIDLIREHLPTRIKAVIEVLGIVLFLFAFAGIGFYFSYSYAFTSFLEGESSKSSIGLGNIWLLKASLPLMFFLLICAGVSHLIKGIAAIVGALPTSLVQSFFGGDEL